MRMQLLLMTLLALAAASPAAADTVQEIAAHGMTVKFQNRPLEIMFSPDGRIPSSNGEISGTWRVDGDKICRKSDVIPGEACTVVPHDKKSGDTFDLQLPLGPATAKIN